MSNRKEFRIYKPNKKGEGAASKFQLTDYRADKHSHLLFLTTTKQTGVDSNGNASFAWSSKDKPSDEEIRFKFEPHELAGLVLLLRKTKGEVKFFHQVEGGSNSVVEFKSNDRGGYYLNISRKQGDKIKKISHSVTAEEGELLRVLLEAAIQRIYQW